MKHAAFFRNLNLGRPNCPTRAQFEIAFLEAGAESAHSFLTNGTMVFAARSEARSRQVLAAAEARLHTACGLKEPAFLRRVDALAALVAADPFAQVDRADVCDVYVTFLHADALPPAPAAWRSARGDVELVDVRAGAAFSLSRVVGRSQGSPNAYLEKLLALPATTRAWNTVVRLVDKHA
jgi:uncharacterized protein (DUF1697 family)